MPEPADREKREKDIARLLLAAWMMWSDVDDWRQMSQSSLQSLVDKARDTVKGIWTGGYLAVLNQFGGRRVERQETGFFGAYWQSLSRSLTQRWMFRLKSYEQDQEAGRYRPRWQHVRGAGQAVHIRVPGLDTSHRVELPRSDGETGMVQTRNGVDFTEWYDADRGLWYWTSEEPNPSDPRAVSGAKPLVYPSDADREGVNWTTGSNMFGELFAVRQVESQGLGRIGGRWSTRQDERVCPICGPLDGQPMKVWRRYFPDGPPAHDNCRCSCEWFHYFNE